MSEELKSYTMEEISKHNTSSDLWVVYKGGVYDVSRYIDEHPGGEEVVLDVAGSDATEAFEDIGHSDDARDILLSILIGKVEGSIAKSTKAEAVSTTGSGSQFPVLALLVLLVAVGLYFSLK